MKYKILIGPSSFGDLDSAPKRILLEAGLEVVDNPFKRKLSKQELMELLPGMTGLLAGLETIDRDLMEKTELRVISRCGSGISNIDLKAAEEFGIKVFSTPDGPTTAVAELTVGALISLVRFIPQMNHSMHQRKWDKRIGYQLKNKVVAIIGFGRIGKEVRRLLSPFEVKVVVVDPSLSGVVNGIPVMGLEEALKMADIILLHCSGNNVLFGEREFKIMKSGVYIINAARGNLIDENLLVHALDSGQVAGAWLDTFSEEPYKGRLCDYEQVILTPHIGSYTLECRRQMETEAAENLIKGLKNIGL